MVDDEENHLRLGGHFQGGSCSINKKYIRTIICIPQEHAKFVDGGNNMGISILPTPSLEFSSSNTFPTANTCANVVKIPLAVGWQYERFKKAMDFAILNNPGFGGGGLKMWAAKMNKGDLKVEKCLKNLL